jgi:hypothetical protein
MTQSPRYAPVLQYLEMERQKIYGNKFADGGASSPGSLPAVIALGNGSDEINVLLRDLRNILSNGIIANVLFGYEEAQKIKDLNTDIEKSTNNGILD